MVQIVSKRKEKVYLPAMRVVEYTKAHGGGAAYVTINGRLKRVKKRRDGSYILK